MTPRPTLADLALLPVLVLPFAYSEGWTYHHTAGRVLFVLTIATLAGATGLLAWRPTRREQGTLDPSAVFGPVALLLVLSAIGCFWSRHRWAAAEGLVQGVLLAAGSLGLCHLLASRSTRRRFLISYGATCGAAALAYFRIFHGTPLGPGHHFPFGNPNVGAGFLLPIAVCGAVVAADARIRRAGPTLAASLLVCLSTLPAIARSDSKGAWLGLAAGAGLGVLLVVPRRGRRFVVAGGLVLAAVVGLALRDGPRRADLERSIGERATFWTTAWSMIEEEPLRFLAGHGQGTFFIEASRFQPLDEEAGPTWATFTRHPHNLVLSIWAENGVAGLLLFAVQILAIGLALRRGRRARTDPLDRAVLTAAAAGLFGLLVHGLVSVAPHQASVAWQAAVLLALVAALGHDRPDLPATSEPAAPLPPRVRRALAGVRVSAAACLVAVWALSVPPTLRSEELHHRAGLDRVAAEEALRRGDRALARDEYGEAIDRYQAALAASPWEAYRTIEIRIERAEALLAYSALADDRMAHRTLAEAVAETERVADAERGLVPYWGLGPLHLAEAALQAGDVRRAREEVLRGCRRRPAEWRYYRFYLLHRDALDASSVRQALLRQLDRGLAAAPEHFPLLAVRALLLAAFGDADDPRILALVADARLRGEAVRQAPIRESLQDEYEVLRQELAGIR